jgi:hypothetical protein
MENLVFRQYALPVSAFDHLKDYQRLYEARYGVHLTNSQVLTIILSEHKRSIEESVEHDATGYTAGNRP